MLADALSRDEFPRSGTVQANVDFLHVRVTVEDHTNYTVGQIPVALNRDLYNVRKVLTTIKKFTETDPVVWAFSQKLNGYGQDFSDPDVQAMIDTLAAADHWPDDVRDAVKAIGVKTMDRWKLPELGIPTDPTFEEVAAVMEPRRIMEAISGVVMQVADGSLKTTDTVLASLENALAQAKSSLGA